MITAATTLAAGYAAVPPGHLATIVTSLEMVRPPSRPGRPVPPGLVLQPFADRDPEAYRSLFRDVGADWLWFSRLTLADDALAAILADEAVEILVLRQAGRDVGMLELDFRQPGLCELVFLGLTGDMIGTGLGGSLMDEALRRAWSRPIERFWLHTCTLDHPGALAFYRRFGFTPFATHVEIAPDPRLTGLLPRTCAPHVPLLG
ncbi:MULTISPECIES: GNAT family N-acetyltransferase [unclassified Methylobacterium]|jgi:GNAT superfamily N-acetyltransferase|uniref:GNAT family N-acetyltransferase n=1 Tax=unclassified Methylobacterium TaxID=2615210 RepID=UPI00135240ED|nr:GNAT family N-acetyltransferase [Methylobacterium sp. 2A]MWV22001.1 GNAT family N-acetyltransferase [Methylobacterium sp. 2A]